MSWFKRLLCALAITLPMLVHAQSPLTVFAAASLKESMDEIATGYQKATGTPVRVSYAASSTLARQVEQGAPADVFISADLEWMDYLQQRGHVEAAQRRNLLGNTLVLIAPAASTAKVDLSKAGSLGTGLGASGRLAVGQVSSVPAGKYGKQALQKLGQWDSVSGRLAESDTVRATLMLVARGEAPLGIVYSSDAKVEPKVRVVATFPASSHTPIIYPAAPLKHSANPANAQKFVQWLSSPSAKQVFLRRGFSLQD